MLLIPQELADVSVDAVTGRRRVSLIPTWQKLTELLTVRNPPSVSTGEAEGYIDLGDLRT